MIIILDGDIREAFARNLFRRRIRPAEEGQGTPNMARLHNDAGREGMIEYIALFFIMFSMFILGMVTGEYLAKKEESPE
jgi:hypothetical protein